MVTAPSQKPSEEPKPAETPKEEPPKEEAKQQPPETTVKKEEPPKPSPPPPPSKPAEKPGKDAAAKPQESKVPGSRNETRVKMSRMRLRIAERLKESQNAAASLTTFNEIDMSELIEMRKRFKRFAVEDFIDRVEQPVYVGDAEEEIFFSGQPAIVAEKLGEKAHYHMFGNDMGAGVHCQFGASHELAQETLDWFAEVVETWSV